MLMYIGFIENPFRDMTKTRKVEKKPNLNLFQLFKFKFIAEDHLKIVFKRFVFDEKP